MQPYQKAFIEFAIEKQVLRFGEFRLKSNRISPYFFDTGLFNDGKSLLALGEFYAAAIEHAEIDFDMIYGPAYKGIPLVSALAIAFQQRYRKNYPFCFDRKERKDHGERGMTFGAEINGRILIVDDVISAGISIREAIDIIRENGASAVATTIALDRQERGRGKHSALQEVERTHGIKVTSIIKLDEIVAYLSKKEKMSSQLDSIYNYIAKYGA